MKKFKFTRDSRRIFELSHKYNDAELNDTEGQELNDLLKDNHEGQIIFLSLRDQELSLSDRLKNRSIHEKTLGESSERPQTNKTNYKNILLIFLSLSTVASLVFIIFKSRQIFEQKTELPKSASQKYERSIASITASIDVLDPTLQQGHDLSTGPLILKQGQIVLEMDSAMEINISAPAELELISGSKIFIKKGKVRFKSLINRKGFSLESEYGTILDQGADFGVYIDQSRASASCFTGTIAYRDDQFKKLIHAQESFSLIQKKYIESETYISTKAIQQQSKENTQNKLTQWKDSIQELKRSSDTAFLYQFQPNPHDDRSLQQDVHRSEMEPAHGKIIGASWEQGRFPGTHSLKFDKPNDRVKFFLNEKFEAMTFHMWVKFDQLTTNNHLGIFLSEKWHPNQLTLQYQITEQKQFFKVSSKDNFTRSSQSIKPSEFLGQWQLISFTFDINKKSFHIYLNGRNMDSTLSYNQDQLTPPFIGWCDLMNWVPLNSRDIRNVPGQVDFLSIHRREFSAAEVLQFYEKSKTQ
jgi:hypothetical protein